MTQLRPGRAEVSDPVPFGEVHHNGPELHAACEEGLFGTARIVDPLQADTSALGGAADHVHRDARGQAVRPRIIQGRRVLVPDCQNPFWGARGESIQCPWDAQSDRSRSQPKAELRRAQILSRV